jgi:hypothetical protein
VPTVTAGKVEQGSVGLQREHLHHEIALGERRGVIKQQALCFEVLPLKCGVRPGICCHGQ